MSFERGGIFSVGWWSGGGEEVSGLTGDLITLLSVGAVFDQFRTHFGRLLNAFWTSLLDEFWTLFGHFLDTFLETF